MDAPVLQIVPPAAGRGPYHLLLAYGGTEEVFREWVAASEVVEACGRWWGTPESALDVSTVEADARLARWSQRTGGLAVRLTRTDGVRWWLAVHHAGQRLLAMVHVHEQQPGLAPDEQLLSDMELGRDPLHDLLASDGKTPTEVREAVARHRADQLAGALQAGGVEADPDRLATLLADDRATDGNLSPLLAELGAGALYKLVQKAPAPEVVEGMPDGMREALSRTMLLGCLVPAGVAVLAFVTFSRFAIRSGASPAAALILGGVAAWLSMWGTRTVFGSAATPGGARQALAPTQARGVLGWAQDEVDRTTRPIRPTAAALDTWGGLFYLLRDIAFFAGIDRPRGPMALYVEAWGMGPSGLVGAINRAASDPTHESAPLFEVASKLIELRTELIAQHLEDAPVAPKEVAQKVRDILRPALPKTFH